MAKKKIIPAGKRAPLRRGAKSPVKDATVKSRIIKKTATKRTVAGSNRATTSLVSVKLEALKALVTPGSRPIIMVSSAVYGFEELLDRLYTALELMGFEVWMSHKGTMPVDSKLTAFENCKRAVRDCNLFLGIILPAYGTGKVAGADSITHDELREAIKQNKPRWILAHDHVVFARTFLDKLGYDGVKRKKLNLKRSDVFHDLRVIDMYELAIRHDVTLYTDRKGNWVQKFTSPDDALLFGTSQFRRYQEAEAFVSEQFGGLSNTVLAAKGKKP
jgi:hypothetical protein